MFHCKELTYIQMHKTGCTHIAKVLSQLFNGQQIGKHNPASPELMTSGHYFISSIRNPWDWYLSLWTYGVQGQGRLWHDLTHVNPRIPASHQNIDIWKSVYDDAANVESFRRWLKLIHNPVNAMSMGERYGETALTTIYGFMTFRHLYLCCQNINQLFNASSISSYADLIKFYQKNYYINFTIHQENLAHDLQRSLENIRPLTKNEIALIRNSEKTNISTRKLSITDYYDDESIELIRQRDKLIIDNFSYS